MQDKDSAQTIGILALQGDFDAHRKILDACGANSRLVREASDLDACDALVLPGGESTAMARGCDRLGLWEPLQARLRAGMPVLGTCAGLILLAHAIEGAATTFAQRTLDVLDIDVARNAYGAQSESFETAVAVVGIEEPVHASFIRAPQITRVGPSVEVLAQYAGRPVLVRHKPATATETANQVETQEEKEGASAAPPPWGTVWGCAFHPEIVGEARIHQLWLDEIKKAATGR